MKLDEFYKELPGGDWRSVVVGKLVGDLIQDENKEKICAFWCDERKSSNDTESKFLYYILTDKRFFEIRVDSGSFSYQSYFLKQLNSLHEKIIPHTDEQHAYKNSIYFRDGSEGVSCYTIELSFSAPEGESNTTKFTFSTSESWKNSRFQKLRNFVKGLHKSLANEMHGPDYV